MSDDNDEIIYLSYVFDVVGRTMDEIKARAMSEARRFWGGDEFSISEIEADGRPVGPLGPVVRQYRDGALEHVARASIRTYGNPANRGRGLDGLVNDVTGGAK